MEAPDGLHDNSSSTPASPAVDDGDAGSSHDQPVDSDNSTVADPKRQLEDIIQNNHPDELKVLLNSRDDVLDTLIEYELKVEGDLMTLSLTPLALAAVLGQTSILELLLEHDADVHAEISDIGGTALHLAVRRGHKDIVDRLLSKDVNLNQQDQKGQSPLLLASRYGELDVVTCLLDADADFSLPDNDGDTPFHLAAIFGHQEVLQLLYKRGLDKYINQTNKTSNAPLHVAIRGYGDDTVEWLLNSGAAIDQPGSDGDTPLIIACTRGKEKTTDVLVRRGADIHKRNDKSLTPILAACLNPNRGVISVLHQFGASPLDVDKEDNNTCFHHVVMSSEESTDVIKSVLGLLLSCGADINQPNKYGLSPLSFACMRQRSKYVELLLDFGADINKINHLNGTTALHVVTRKPNDEIVNILLERKADTTVKAHDGRTALIEACVTGQLNQAKALLRNGSKAMVLDRDGDTPLRCALLCGNIQIALEILATEEYYPRNLAVRIPLAERMDDIHKVENHLLEHFDNAKFETPEQLQVVMYWAVSNGALALARKCIEHDEAVLQWDREGNTWLHIASDSGALEIAELLLTMIVKKPEQAAEWANAEAILKQNSRGDSPLTICIDQGHDEVQKLFWNELRRLGSVDTDFIKLCPAIADGILELLAIYEKPGYEDVLIELLQRWYDGGDGSPDHNTALHWAVRRRKVVVVWWLLSKGGYSSGAIESAQKLVSSPSGDDDCCDHILKLLLYPPPLLDRVPNPNKEHIRTFKAGVGTIDAPELDSLGHIVDILSDGKSISIPYGRHRVRDIIYGAGPESLMKNAENDLRQHDLNVLKGALGDRVPEQSEKSYELVPDWMKSISSQQNNCDQDLLVRWIHLPVNELHLMRDLVSRLSHDSKRSEIDHMILMNHFNQSWSELAAGAGQCYMKPQCVPQQNQKNQDDHSSRNLCRSRGCMALYMPYLTIGSYGCIDHGPVTNAPKVFDESNNNRNSRRIRHTPMTLDQYYYPTITDTSVRDDDQVLSKFLQKKREQEEHENPPKYNDSKSADKKILTVSNLWVWILDGGTIITATTASPDQKSPRSLQEINGNLLEAALRNILYNKDKSVFEGAVSVYSVMELILGAATGLFIEKSVITPDQSAKGPIEIFRESIREVANEETSLFLGFLNKLRREAGGQQEQLGQKLGYKPPDVSALSDPHHVISSEMELLYTIRDIRDELQMLRSLAEDQEIVWEQAFAFIYLKDEARRFEFYTPTDVKEDLDTMLLEADKIEKYINTLLDLRQAEYGRLEANDSARLSKIIFVFTVITIVFLPLSFLSSLFALDVSVFPHEAGSLKYQGWWLFPILFGVTAIVSGPTIFLAWKLDAISARFKRLEAIPASFKKLEAISAFKRRETTKDGETAPHTAETTRWAESLRRRLRSKDDKNDIIPLSSRNVPHSQDYQDQNILHKILRALRRT